MKHLHRTVFPHRPYAFIAFLLALALSNLAHGQVAGGTIEGLITDPSGAVINGAHITVSDLVTGVQHTASTNSAGLFAVPNLPPAVYSISVQATGFSGKQTSQLTLTVGGTLTVNLSLSVGNSTESVEVQDTTDRVDLSSSSISEVVDSQTIRELPLNGRDWSQLIALEPGANDVRNQSAIGSAGTSDVNRVLRGFGSQMSIAGTRPQQNNYRLDGVSFNDYTNGAPGGVLGTISGGDAVQEFSVITTNYDAEYGKTSGGVVNAVTRSGSNVPVRQ